MSYFSDLGFGHQKLDVQLVVGVFVGCGCWGPFGTVNPMSGPFLVLGLSRPMLGTSARLGRVKPMLGTFGKYDFQTCLKG